MKPWNRIGLRPAIGLAIEDQQISLSVVATTPGGRKEVARDVQSCAGESQKTVLERMLAPWLGQPRNPLQKTSGKGKHARRPWVQVALPESRVFQAVVPITGANRSSPPQAYFMEAVQATNVRAEDRIIDLIKLELNKQPLACLVASPRTLIADLIAMLDSLGTRVAMIEPAPAALFRAGAFREKPPRGSKVCVRFFLGKAQAIGVLAADMQPLLWHAFELPSEDVTAAILATYSTLWMQGRHGRITLPIDTVVVHGRPDLKLTVNANAFRERTGARLLRCDGPDYGPTAAAMGTALANPLTEAMGLDLARGLKPAVPIREIFPWGELALQSTLVAGFSLFLIGAAVDVDTKFKSARAEAAAFTWLKDQNQGKLDAEKKLLEERIKTVEAFLKTRVDWTTQLRTIAADTPETTIITSLTGEGEAELPGKGNQGKAKKQLIVNFDTPLAEDGAMPGEIDKFISALRGEPSILGHFPNIEVSGLRTGTTGNSHQQAAQYSVVCLPKAESIKGGNTR